MSTSVGDGTDRHGPARWRAFAPGRVNLIGEHTDYTGGLALPIATDLGTTIEFREADTPRVRLRSRGHRGRLDFTIPGVDPGAVDPAWGRYVAAVASELVAITTVRGVTGEITSTLPSGAGMSSSAALEVAAALALGGPRDPVEIARLCRRAEVVASGVPCGVMDQMTSAGGVDGAALLIDCRAETSSVVMLPDSARVLVVHSGQHRRLAGSAYARRVVECAEAERYVGPLRDAAIGAWRSIDDEVIAARARHVITENARVAAFVDAISDGDLVRAGALMSESHRSLRDDHEVSTSALDRVVDELLAEPSVHGARMMGAGFGGCVVALVDDGCPVDVAGRRHWVVRPSAGARIDLA